MNNKHSRSESWDIHWDLNKRVLYYNKVTDLLTHLWFDCGNFLSNHIKRNENLKFIELGCGGGTFLLYFTNKFKNLKIFGIDISSIGCEIALKKIAGKVKTSNIIHGDILTNKYQDKSDISFSFGLIEHFDKPEIALEKHVDLLKKDGIMLCIIPNLIGLQGKVLKSKSWFSEDEWKKRPKGWIFGMKQISIESLKKWCISAGLEDIKILPIGGFFPFFLVESIDFKKKSRGSFIKNIHRFLLLPLFVIINIPTLFRLNSIYFSPYIITIGRKK